MESTLAKGLIYNDDKYLMPISLIVIFTLTFLYRKKSRKECWKILLMAFIVCSSVHYTFFAIVRNELSVMLLKDAVGWSFCTLLNFIFLRFLIEIMHEFEVKKAACIAVFAPVILFYLLFFPRIWDYEETLFDLLLYRLYIFKLIGEMVTTEKDLGYWQARLLISDEYKYMTSISLIVIFTLTFLYRQKNWKKCGKAFLWAFIIGSCIHYVFFAIVYHFPPIRATWDILSMDLMKDACEWIFYTLINYIFLRLILEILHKLNVKKVVYEMVFIPVFLLYMMFYLWIEVFEARIFGPLLYTVFRLIPDISY